MAITTTEAPMLRICRARRRNSSSPSLRDIEFTIPCPCKWQRPTETTSQEEESIITGTDAATASDTKASRKRAISAGASSMASSTFTSTTCAPANIWLRAMSTASSIFPSLMSLKNLRLPATLHRSPTLKRESGYCGTVTASRPERCMPPSSQGMGRDGDTCANSAIALIWHGVVPQHPPTIFNLPAANTEASDSAMDCGVQSYWPSLSGNPALGCMLMPKGMDASISIYGISLSAPNPQFNPTDNGRACATEATNASNVWPDSVRPFSVSVTETIMGTSRPDKSIMSSAALIAAFALSVSKTVSISRTSTPPLTNAEIWSRYALYNTSQVRASPSPAKEAAIESDLFVGPTEPATHTVRPGFDCMKASASVLAILAPSKFICEAYVPRP